MNLKNRINKVNINTSSNEISSLINEVLKLTDDTEKTELINLIDVNSKKEEAITLDESIKDELETRINSIKPFYSNEKLNEIYSDIISITDLHKQSEMLHKFNIVLNNNNIKFIKTDIKQSIKNTESINKKIKLNKKWLIGCTALGLAVIIGGVSLKNRPTESTVSSYQEDNSDDEENYKTTDKVTNYTVDNTNTEVTGTVDHFTTDFGHFDVEDNYCIIKMRKYIEDCGFVKREFHTGIDTFTMNTTMIDFRNRVKAGDGTARASVENYDGNPQMVFGFMSASLGDVKKFQKNPTDIEMTEFKSNGESYGMQYWVDGLAKQNNTATIDIPAIESNYNYYVDKMAEIIEKGCTSEQDLDQQLNDMYYIDSLMSPEEYQEYQDCLYTIFYSFYEEEGIEDYYYILDTPEDAHDRLAEDYSNFDYQPRKSTAKQLTK